ncbi:MAG TPA: hypothetical protein PK858_02510, partial [Saprospiraceae bacterium]|nr:hypothetical protein [Saprospiraceae bacterium]
MKKQCTYLLLALCLYSVGAFAQQNPYGVRFAWGVEQLPANYDEVRRNPDVQPAELAQGYYVRYVQCHQVPDQQSRTTLEAAGLRIYGYVPFGTYLVGIPQGFDLDRLGALKVRSIVAVQPDWHNARDLLGYYNALTAKFHPTPFLRFLMRAAADPAAPYFVCLDEMNLARPEYYLAPILSAIETEDHLLDLGAPGASVETVAGELLPNPFRLPL